MFESADKVAVKVCGLTRREDALGCAEAGVQMLGLNFWPQSPRCISPNVAEEIISAVRAQFRQIKFVGIFVDEKLPKVREIALLLGLDAVQLHGSEPPEYARALSEIFVIKAFRVGPSFQQAQASAYPCDALLLDSWSDRAPGGTGEIFSWETAAALRPQVKRLILAGGLTTANVAEAVRLVRPDAVDVCSGVEDTPGRKNVNAVRNFVAAVRRG